jgi:hypothetical protein
MLALGLGCLTRPAKGRGRPPFRDSRQAAISRLALALHAARPRRISSSYHSAGVGCQHLMVDAVTLSSSWTTVGIVMTSHGPH